MDRIRVCDCWKYVIYWLLSYCLTDISLDMKFVLLHEAKNEEGIRAFFAEVWELYVKVCIIPPAVGDRFMFGKVW